MPPNVSDAAMCDGGCMADFRLRSDDGEVVDTATHSDDQAAVAWRSAHPFIAAGTDEGRQLRLEKLIDNSWVEIDALGTADID